MCRKEIEIQQRYPRLFNRIAEISFGFVRFGEENRRCYFHHHTQREEKIRVGRIELRSSVCQHHESPKKMMTHFKFNDLVLAQNKVRVMTINRNLPLENESIDSVQI
jgi:hypothetical protein